MSRLSETAAKGNRLATLHVLRDSLAEWLDETDSGRDRAALSLRFMATLAEIDELEREAAPAAPKGSGLDVLSVRRAAREARASGRTGAAAQ